MVKIVSGNLFNSNAQTWVNPVNCVGVMGKGIAREFKKRFPDMFNDYRLRCAQHQIQLGQPYLYKRTSLPWILVFPTKFHWRNPANLNAIVNGLQFLLANYKLWNVSSLAVPALGCGLGKLNWHLLQPILLNLLSSLDIPVELYQPSPNLNHYALT